MTYPISSEGLRADNWELPAPSAVQSSQGEAFLIQVKDIEEEKIEQFYDCENPAQFIELIEPYINCGVCIHVDKEKIANGFSTNYEEIESRYRSSGITSTLKTGFLNILNNYLHFLRDLSEIVQSDLPELETKFNFDKNEILSIELACLPGDLHHSGKVPVKITFNLKSGEPIEVVFKPRVMEFERRICDNHTGGIFHALNTKFHDKPFPEYPVHAGLKGTFQGYSQFITGVLAVDFESRVNNKITGVTDTFLLNDIFFRWTDYILIRQLHLELPQSVPLQQLIENPSLLDHFEFCERPDVKKLFEVFPSKALANVLKIPVRLECLQPNGLESLAKKTFFYQRSVELLRKDYLMFKVLEKLQAEDLHTENFIVLSDGTLVPIDLEVFGESHSFNATHVLEMIELAFEAKDKAQFKAVQKEAQNLELLFSGTLSPLVEEFKECIDLTPQRYLPLTTEDFYKMRSDFLAELPIADACKRLLENMRRRGFEIPVTIEQLQSELSKIFQQGDIPYFTICQGKVTLGSILIALKQEDKKL